MIYHVLGKEIEIYSFEKPIGGWGSNFEVTGNKALNEIGLNEKFWFRAPYYFSNVAPIENVTNENDPKNDYQCVLAIFLHKSIVHGELTDQFVW